MPSAVPYSVTTYANTTDLKTQHPGGTVPVAAAILGYDWPIDEDYSMYVWDDTSEEPIDEPNILKPTQDPTDNGRWLKVDIASLPQVNTDWDASSGISQILNKPVFSAIATTGSYTDLISTPTIPDAQVQADWTASSGIAQILHKPSLATVATSGSYTDLSSKPSLASVATSGSYLDLTNKPSLFSGSYTDLTSKPTFSTVASTGSYNDLSSKPTIPAAQINSDWSSASGLSQILNKPSFASVATSGNYSDLSGKPSLATVATSGSYSDLTGKPTIPSALTVGNPTGRTLVLATAYQANDNTKAAIITITVGSSATLSLTAGTTISGEVRIGTANTVATGASGSAVGNYKNSLTGTLVIGLALSTESQQTFTIVLPIGGYFAVRQTAGSGLTIISAFEQTLT